MAPAVLPLKIPNSCSFCQPSSLLCGGFAAYIAMWQSTACKLKFAFSIFKITADWW